MITELIPRNVLLPQVGPRSPVIAHLCFSDSPAVKELRRLTVILADDPVVVEQTPGGVPCVIAGSRVWRPGLGRAVC